MTDWKEVPFDLFCPKVHDRVKERTCPECHIYFPSKKGMTSHKKIHKPGSIFVPRPSNLTDEYDEVLDEDDSTDEDGGEERVCDIPIDADRMPIVDIFSILDSPWEEELVIEQP